MTETVKRTGPLRFFRLSLCLALCLVLGAAWGLGLSARAFTVPDRPDNQVVLDEAGVLSAETEDAIIEENRRLFPETGAQVAVVAVDFLDGASIEDYAYTLFNAWGIGSQERNNGLLLLLAIGEDNYYAMAGYGIDDFFDGAKLKEMLNTYLEPDFAAKDYDAGVEKFFSAAVDDLRTYYQENPPQEDPYPVFDYEEAKPTPWEHFWATFGSAMVHVAKVVVVVAVLLFVFILLRNLGKGGGGPRSGGSGGGGFWSGWFLGNMMGRSSHRRYGWRPPPPPPGGRPPRPPRGGFGGGFGGFHGGGGGGFGAGRGGGGGFHGGGGTHGGGAGRG